MSERLDVLLVRQKLAESREKAKAYIAAGSVFVDGKRADKAASRFEENVLLELKGETMKYVSRGGLHGCWSVYRRFYRLHASERRGESLCD